MAKDPAVEPSITARQFERACLMAKAGRTSEARAAYLDLLSREPSHRGALNNLGTLLLQAGYRTAAVTAFTQAAARHPDDPMSHVNLGHALRENNDLAQARAHYEAAIRLQPGHPEAHQGLSLILADAGDPQGAAHHRKIGFGTRPVVTLPYRGNHPPISLLVLSGTAGGNVPINQFLDDRIFQVTMIFVEYLDPAAPLPPHNLVFNAIGDPDIEAPALAAARRVLALTDAPILNLPSAVAATGRADNATRLAGIPGVLTSGAFTLPREMLETNAAATTLARHGFDFPILIRTPGFHMGRHFLKVESLPDLPAALAELPGAELTVMRYLDSRGAGGKVRKYRAMTIDGVLYPLHAAISSHWKIHYFSADMADNPEHRAEDAEFLENMPGVLGPVAMTALEAIQSRLGLDYAGIDFGLSAHGEILLYEANATMVVPPPPPDPKWAYRRPAFDRIDAAVRNMILRWAAARSREM